MFRSRICCLLPRRRCMSYFSNEFNNVANHGPSKLPNPVPLKNIDLDLFVNPDHRQMELMDQLAKLRQQKESTSVPLWPSTLVKQLLESTSPQEAIAVLRSPTQYGLFVDQFSGCHLIDTLLHQGLALEAAQVAALLVERGLCNSELIEALSLQSFYAFMKNFEPLPSSQDQNVSSTAEVEKVRVKFIRNYVEDPTTNTEEKQLGRAMIKLTSNKENPSELKSNIALLGFVLTGQVTDGSKFLAQSPDVFHKEILQLCQTVIESLKVEQSDEFLQLLQQTLDKSATHTKSIDELLEASVKLSVQKLEPKLLAEYAETYQEWAKNYQNAVQKQHDIQDLHVRVENIKNTLDKLEAKRQNLWFFENKEDIDIQIFKKKIYYPKRWFGKKKKPKAVDTFYVPPNITRGSN